MGRTEASLGRPPPGFRRDARAKKAKATVNKLIPSLLNAHPRARQGVDAAELILEPPSLAARRVSVTAKTASAESTTQTRKKGVKGKGKKGKGRGRDEDDSEPPTSTTPAPGPAPAPARRRRSDETSPVLLNDNKPSQPPRIRFAIADTLTVARYLLEPDDSQTGPKRADLANTTARVGILNMASPLSPGGGFLNGAAAQEESLCMRTTLLPSLRDEFYRLPELGAVYTPDVLVFRDEAGNDLDKRDRWFVNCVSAAMLRFPDVEDVEDDGTAPAITYRRELPSARNSEPDFDGGEEEEEEREEGDGVEQDDTPVLKRYANQKDKDLVLQKMRIVLRIFQAKGCRKVVLGAGWGCGAYGNPLEEVAAAWRKILLQPVHVNSSKGKPRETWDGIDEVVFVIKGGGMAGRFEEAFLGSSSAVATVQDDNDASSAATSELLEKIDPAALEALVDSRKVIGDVGEVKDTEALQMRELRERIATLESQVQQARTPQLRNGLSAVLAGLMAQLPRSEQSISHDGQQLDDSEGEVDDSEIDG